MVNYNGLNGLATFQPRAKSICLFGRGQFAQSLTILGSNFAPYRRIKHPNHHRIHWNERAKPGGWESGQKLAFSSQS
jgi:hypothetical protein